MPLVNRGNIPKDTLFISVKKKLDVLDYESTDTPIIKRAIRDAKDYVEKHLLLDWLPIEEEILKDRLTALELFIDGIKDARKLPDIQQKNGKIVDLYSQAEKLVKFGSIPYSNWNSILIDGHNGIIGKYGSFSTVQRSEAKAVSEENPCAAQKILDIRGKLSVLTAHSKVPGVTTIITACQTYLGSLTGEQQLAFKDRFPIRGKILIDRLSGIEMLLDKVLKAFKTCKPSTETEHRDLPNEALCPITLDVMIDPVVALTTGKHSGTYERSAINAYINDLRSQNKPLIDPFRRQLRLDASGNPILVTDNTALALIKTHTECQARIKELEDFLVKKIPFELATIITAAMHDVNNGWIKSSNLHTVLGNLGSAIPVEANREAARVGMSARQ